MMSDINPAAARNITPGRERSCQIAELHLQERQEHRGQMRRSGAHGVRHTGKCCSAAVVPEEGEAGGGGGPAARGGGAASTERAPGRRRAQPHVAPHCQCGRERPIAGVW